MTFRAKKFAVISVIVIATVGLLAVAGGVYTYFYQIKNNAAVSVIGVPHIENPKDIKVGDTVVAVCDFKAPWHWRALEASAVCAEGTKLSATPLCSKESLALGYWVWQLKVKMVVYRTGTIKPGKMSVTFRSSADSKNKGEIEKTFDLAVPGFAASALELKDQKLLLADSMETIQAKAKRYLLIIIAVIAVAALALIVYLFLRRLRKRKLAPVPPWERAITRIYALREALKAHKVSLENCFIQLTDIVRDYLEKRFKLKAPAQTTPEFLESLRHDSSKLAEEHRKFLKGFMTAADLIKFAKLPPEEADFLHALDKAKILVDETRPDSLDKENKNGGKI